MFNNRFWSKAILSLLVTGALTLVTACGAPATPPTDAGSNVKPAKAKPAAPAKSAAKAAAAKPARASAAGKAAAAKKGKQMASNGNFANWDSKAPRRWIAAPAEKVVKSVGSSPNRVSVELKPSGAGKYTMLRQHLSGNLAGKTVTLTLRAKSAEAKDLSAKLLFQTPTGPKSVALDAAGPGGWKTVTRTVKVPAEAKDGSAMLALVLRPTAKKSAFVDYVTINAN